MKKSRIDKFQEKIQEVYGLDSDAALYTAGKVMYALPKKLLPNIDEWCEGKELSVIKIGDFSVPMLLAMWKSDDFICALNCMIELDRNPEAGKVLAWRMRR